MHYYAVIDTNALVSAMLKFQSVPGQVEEIIPDSKDIVFYEVVMEGRREHDDAYLVTGNIKHFPVNPLLLRQMKCLISCRDDKQKIRLKWSMSKDL